MSRQRQIAILLFVSLVAWGLIRLATDSSNTMGRREPATSPRYSPRSKVRVPRGVVSTMAFLPRIDLEFIDTEVVVGLQVELSCNAFPQSGQEVLLTLFKVRLGSRM